MIQRARKKISGRFRVWPSIALAYVSLLAGCTSEIVIHPRRDPGGGALSDSVACAYDGDRAGLWYVLFIRVDGLLAAVHRHDPGVHVFAHKGDLIFYSRCSGRNEVLDVMGQTFTLSRGTVFLCDVQTGEARVEQLSLPPTPCRGDDTESVAKALYELSQEPRAAAFLRGEAQSRLLADWKIAERQKQRQEPTAQGQ